MASAAEQANMDSATRQRMVNEWEYNHKLDLLFSLQLLFLGLMIVAILASLAKYGLFTFTFVTYVAVLVLIIVGIIWVLRSRYTQNIRDRFFWSKRNFSGDGQIPSNISPETLKAQAELANQVCTAAISGNVQAVAKAAGC